MSLHMPLQYSGVSNGVGILWGKLVLELMCRLTLEQVTTDKERGLTCKKPGTCLGAQ